MVKVGNKKSKKALSSEPVRASQSKKKKITQRDTRRRSSSQFEQNTSSKTVEEAPLFHDKTLEPISEQASVYVPDAIQEPKRSMHDLRKKLKKGSAPITDDVTLGLMNELESQMNIQVPKAQKATQQILESIGFEGKESFISPKALAALRGNLKKKK